MADRNPAKRKRAAQNKAAREALAARRAKAADTPSTPAPAPSRGRGGRATPARGQAAPGPNRPARTRPTAPARQPSSKLGRSVAAIQAETGGKAILFAFLFAIVAGVMLLFFPVTPRNVLEYVGGPKGAIADVRAANKLGTPKGYDPKKVVVQSTYAIDVLGPIAILLAILPVVVAGAALTFLRRPNRRRNITICAFVMGLLVLTLGQVGLFFFFSLGALIYGTYQIRKAEGPPPPRRGRDDDGADDQPDGSDLVDDEVDSQA